jgi:hypothetical protein
MRWAALLAVDIWQFGNSLHITYTLLLPNPSYHRMFVSFPSYKPHHNPGHPQTDSSDTVSDKHCIGN